MGNIANLFGGAYVPRPDGTPPPRPEQQLYEALCELGQIDMAPSDIVADGEIHRFRIDGKRGENGWYVLYGDGVPAGAYGDWATGQTGEFVADMGRQLTSLEQMRNAQRVAEARQARDRARTARSSAAMEVASAVWEQAEPAGDRHPYLESKGIGASNARVGSDGRLLVPMRGMDGDLVSLQYIADDGSKRFHRGAPAGDGHYRAGPEPDGLAYVVEGFADAETIHQTIGATAYAALSADAIPSLARRIRERYGELLQIVVVADNDSSGAGAKAAKAAAESTGSRTVHVPDPGDINDYYCAGGDVAGLLQPDPEPGFLVHASEFIQQPAPIQWLIKGWLQRDAMMMLFGPSGAGKSFIAIDHACHIAAGLEEWNGCRVRGGPVIYLAGEGHHGMRARIAGWMDAHGSPPLDMYISQHGADLNTAAGYSQVVEAIAATGAQPVLIIVDTLHRFLHGDENSAEDARTMIDACNSLMRHFGCSVQLVHHTGVSPEAQKRGRGSSAWKGALDIELCVDGSVLSQTKTKDSEPVEALNYSLESHPVPGWVDEDGEQVTTALVHIGGVAPTVDDLAKEKNVILSAWEFSGCDLSDSGLPYISSAALERWLYHPDGGGLSTSTAERYARSAGSRRGGELISTGYLDRYRDGYVVRCEESLTQYMLIRQGRAGK